MKKMQYMIAALVALAGTCHGQTVCDWNVAGNGNWNNAANWNPQNVPDSAGEAATIDLAGTYTVTMNMSPTIDWLDISNADATLDLRGNTLTLLDTAGLTNAGTIYNYSNSTINGNITNDGLIHVPGGGNWTLWLNGPTVTNNATIIVNPENSGYYGQLAFNADVTLDGTGIVLLDWSTAYISTGGGMTLTQAQGHQIEGRGEVRATMVNNGVIAGNVDGATLKLNYEPKTNNNQIIATNNATVEVENTTVTQGVLGIIQADAATVTLDSCGIVGGTLDTINGGVVQTYGGTSTLTSVTNLGLVNLLGGGNWHTHVAGTGLTNDGTIVVNSNNSGHFASLLFTETGTLDGTGTVTLNHGPAYVQTAADATMTQAATHTIDGHGYIQANMVNDGFVDANVAGTEIIANTYPIANNNTMKASGDGGVLRVQDITVDQTGGGTLLAEDASAVRLDDATVVGGTLDSNGTGVVETRDGDSTLSGVTNEGQLNLLASNWYTYVTSAGLTNNGNILVNSNNSGYWASLVFSETGTLDGTGTVTLNHGPAYVQTAADATVTQAATHTIDGHGYIQANMVNNGLVDANVTGAEIIAESYPITNNSTMKASGAGALRVRSTTVDQTGGGTLLAEDASAIRLDGATVVGGTLNSNGTGTVETRDGNSTLTGVTNESQLNLLGGNLYTYVTGTGLTNNGNILVNSNNSGYWAGLQFNENGTLDGTGTVTLNHGPAYVQTTADATMTQAATHTIDGRGYIQANMVNNGLVDANVTGAELVANTYPIANNSTMKASGNGGVLRVQDITVDQTGGGTLLAEDASAVRLDDATVIGGTLNSNGTGAVETRDGNSTLTDVTNEGQLNLLGGNLYTYVTGTGLTNNGDLVVNSNSSGYFASLIFTETGTLDGTGTVTLNKSNASFKTDTGITCTIGPDQTIAGVGSINGTFVNQGTISPGMSTGTIQADGSLTMAPDAVLSVELSSTTSYDQVAGSADIALDGTVQVMFIDGYAPAFGHEFWIVSGPAITDEFAAIDGPPLPGELVYRVRYEPNNAVLVVTCPPDLNADVEINSLDFIAFLNAFVAGDPIADYNEDGTVNSMDFIAFLNAFTAGCS